MFELNRTPPQTTGVAKPEPKIKTGGRVDEGLHGQESYAGGRILVKRFLRGDMAAGHARRKIASARLLGRDHHEGMVMPGRGKDRFVTFSKRVVAHFASFAGVWRHVRQSPVPGRGEDENVYDKVTRPVGCAGTPGQTGKRACGDGGGLLI